MMKSMADTQPETPFQKFKQLTERLLSVPKKEIDQRQKDYDKKKRGKKKQGPDKS
jgi:hypothetical protein